MGGVESKCIGENGGGDLISGRSNGVTCGVPTSGGGSLSKSKLPIPEHVELEQRFAKILVKCV